ncbi:MAG TPA: response regulator [Anaeromyxobacter sp.]|nr:response regulator [Anaeromyxobacter sp.]
MIALVVDDDRDARGLMCEALEEAGWRVELAEDGVAALGRVPQVRPDVILLDLRMPHLDGVGLLKMLRTTPAGRAVRVILTTGAEVAAETRALADAVLQKPFTGWDLLQAVGRPPLPARPHRDQA